MILDDGSYYDPRKIRVALNNFTVKDLEMFVDIFFNKFCMSSYVIGVHSKYPVFVIGEESTVRLKDYNSLFNIVPYSMLYKFDEFKSIKLNSRLNNHSLISLKSFFYHDFHIFRRQYFIKYCSIPDDENHMLCGYCHSKVDHKKYFRHLKAHLKLFECNICGCFFSEETLKKHINCEDSTMIKCKKCHFRKRITNSGHKCD